MRLHLSDDFSRTLTGAIDLGSIEDPAGLYAYSGDRQGTSTINVDGSKMKGFINAANNQVRCELPIARLNGDMSIEVEAEAIDKQWEWMLGLRSTSHTNDGIFARLVFNTSEVARGHFVWRNGATRTDITTIANISGAPAFTANTRWCMRFWINQTSSTGKDLKAKLWRKSDGEPGPWTLETSTTSGSNVAGGLCIGMLCGSATSNMFSDVLRFYDLTPIRSTPYPQLLAH